MGVYLVSFFLGGKLSITSEEINFKRALKNLFHIEQFLPLLIDYYL